MDKLKTVMQRIKQDREDGLHPYLDPAHEQEVTNKLRKVLKLNIQKSKGSGSATEEGEQSTEPEESSEPVEIDETEIQAALKALINERKAKEQGEDGPS